MAGLGAIRSVTSLSDCVATAVAWRERGTQYLTAIVKATFRFVPDGVMQRAAPEAIVERDQHYGNHPARSVKTTSDLAPRRARTDVVLTGHAHPPAPGAASWPIRFALFDGGAPLLDKALLVVRAERDRKVPVVFERTAGGIAFPENPFGAEEPQILNPAAPGAPACYGPIAAAWPVRRKRLGKTPRREVEGTELQIPDGFDWLYYQSAPADQQLDAALRGDEILVMEGLHPKLQRLATRLPAARARAKVFGLKSLGIDEGREVALAADTLRIDADTEEATLVWRGHMKLPHAHALRSAEIVAGVWIWGENAEFPDAVRRRQDGEEPQVAPRKPRGAAAPMPAEFSTMTLGEDDFEEVESKPARKLSAEHLERTAAISDAEAKMLAQQSFLPFSMSRSKEEAVRAEGRAADDGARSGARSGSVAPPAPSRADADLPFSPDRTVALEAPSEDADLDDHATVELPLEALLPEPRAQEEAQESPPKATPKDPLLQTVALPPEEGRAPEGELPFAALPEGQIPEVARAKGPPARRDVGLGGTAELRPEEQAGLATAQVLPFLQRAPKRSEPEKKAEIQRQPEFRRRQSRTIPFVTNAPFIGFALPWQLRAGQEVRAVIVKATYDLVRDGPAVLRQDPDPATGDAFEAGDPQRGLLFPSDFVIFKPKADVTLHGHAHAPGEGVTASEVRFRFGGPKNGFDRRAFVLGDRVWEGTTKRTPSRPQRWKRVPLTCDHAFGGAGVAANPLGRGGGAGAETSLLPNIEVPERLLRALGEEPAPAIFGSIPAWFAERARKQGTYDAKWQARRWPYFPDDFDWGHWNDAPAPQQLDYLRGDEPYLVAGAHPEWPVVEGKLPGDRPRCFVQHAAEAGGAFFEVILRLDSVRFSPDENKITCLFRGLLEVDDDQASEVAEVYLISSTVDATEPLEEIRARYWAERAPYIPIPAPSDGSDTPKNDNRAASAPVAASRVQQALERAGAPAAAAGATGVGASGLEAPPQWEEETTQAFSAKTASARRKALEARVKSAPQLDEEVFDGEDLTGIDLTGVSLKGASFLGARLVGGRLDGADLTGALLAGADLTDSSLRGASLSGADLTGATLEGADLEGAVLDRADLSGVRARRARFTGTKGIRPRLAEGDFSLATFEGASLEGLDLTRATLDEASFDAAKIPDVRLYEARGRKASFREATLTDARANGACLLQTSFFTANAAAGVWDDAILDGSSFLGAKLMRASFSGASCVQVVFSGADAGEAQLVRAKLQRASFLKARFSKASFEGADLGGADFRGACLHQAEMWKARTMGAKLEGAIVTGTKLEGRV